MKMRVCGRASVTMQRLGAIFGGSIFRMNRVIKTGGIHDLRVDLVFMMRPSLGDLGRRRFFTTEWDVGPGERGEFPPKWMSEDGKTMYLVFSGDDNFCVRKATLELGA